MAIMVLTVMMIMSMIKVMMMMMTTTTKLLLLLMMMMMMMMIVVAETAAAVVVVVEEELYLRHMQIKHTENIKRKEMILRKANSPWQKVLALQTKAPKGHSGVRLLARCTHMHTAATMRSASAWFNNRR